MTKQLILLDAPPSWRLDERTRRLGRAGVAKARAALLAERRARQPREGDDRHSAPSRRAA